MKLLKGAEIKLWDAYTIAHEGISSWQLMERASEAFVARFEQYCSKRKTISVLCGTGNNGGDGLAIARMLQQRGYQMDVYVCHLSKRRSSDFEQNLNLLQSKCDIIPKDIREGDTMSYISGDILIDAILGTGVNKPLGEYWASFVNNINALDKEVVSVDIPSGLYCDEYTSSEAIVAKRVLSFEVPKRAFLVPDNAKYVGDFEVLPIGLHPDFLYQIPCSDFWVDDEYVLQYKKKRTKFGHKGAFGHALLAVGQKGMTGAAILSARACVRAGVGLLSVASPECNRVVLQTSVPEAMCIPDLGDNVLQTRVNASNYSAVGIGCGIGKQEYVVSFLAQMLKDAAVPMVLDADALNILSEHKNLFDLLPQGTILTPHLKEFERLFGKSENGFERLKLLRQKAQKHQLVIVLKGAHSVVADSQGILSVNSSGNVGMATGGSGDVLTGIISSLLAQGYAPDVAARLGVYWHGKAGDLAAKEKSMEGLIASDIVDYLPKVFL